MKGNGSKSGSSTEKLHESGSPSPLFLGGNILGKATSKRIRQSMRFKEPPQFRKSQERSSGNSKLIQRSYSTTPYARQLSIGNNVTVASNKTGQIFTDSLIVFFKFII